VQQDYRQLLKPEIINSVSGLALISRLIVDGYLNGVNHSRRVGLGMEFSQFRSYEPGDDLRLLDWKMLARSGRYYIKQSEIETNISVKFILDASTSMKHSEKQLSKFDYAKVVIATLAYLSQNQGDAIGLFAMNDQNLHSIYPKIQKQHYNRLLLELSQLKCEGQWPADQYTSLKLHDRTHKEIMVFITDMHEYNEELTHFIKKLKSPRNEVVVLHLMGKNELEFDYKGVINFEDIETGTKVKVDAREGKKQYLKALDKKLSATKYFLLNLNINYHLFNIDDPIGETLQYFLKKRSNLI